MITLSILLDNSDNARLYLDKINLNNATNTVYKYKNRELGYIYLKLASKASSDSNRIELIYSAYRSFLQADIKDEDKVYFCLLSIELATKNYQSENCSEYVDIAIKFVNTLDNELTKG